MSTSKFGGRILWPKGEAWPASEEFDDLYVPVLQLNSGADLNEAKLARAIMAETTKLDPNIREVLSNGSRPPVPSVVWDEIGRAHV